jgi:hypothetical protein
LKLARDLRAQDILHAHAFRDWPTAASLKRLEHRRHLLVRLRLPRLANRGLIEARPARFATA